MHMMRKISFVFVALLAATLAAWAGDPWKQKTDKQWDEGDLRRIMNDSPWARRVTINSSSTPITPGGPPSSAPAAGSGYGGAGALGGAGGGGNVSRGSSAPLPNPGAASEVGGEMSFTVRWASALTLRRAAVRAAIKRGAFTEADGERWLAVPVDDYQVDLIGKNLSMFEKVDDATLLKVTFLRPKSTKGKLTPVKVETERTPDSKSLSRVVFHFAKRAASGEASISTDEKGIEFVTEPRGITIKATFEPPKMVAQQGPDW